MIVSFLQYLLKYIFCKLKLNRAFVNRYKLFLVNLNQRLKFLPILRKNLESCVMKAVKIFSVWFVIIFLLNISVSEILGQAAQNSRPPEKIESKSEKKMIQPELVKNENPQNQKPIGTIDGPNPNIDTNTERYRIGYQDTIEVVVFKHPELSQLVAVNPDGTINLPRIDFPIVAVCKTEGELKENITALYKKNYLRNPFVNVRVSEQKSQSLAVLGAVEKPGNFYLNRKVRLLELLSLAGGHDVEFAGGKIQVARIGNIAGCKEDGKTQNEAKDIFVSYSLKDVLEGKQNPWMEPGDIISVLKSEEAYVIGDVFKPAKVPVNEPTTLTQAIAFAGGASDTASTKQVVIQRQASGNSPKIDLVFNLKDIRDKKIPDPLLQANDIVDVGTDKLKSIRKGLLRTLTNGLPSIFTRVPAPF